MFVAIGCAHETVTPLIPDDSSKEMADLTLQIPFASMPGTRALTPADENNIESVNVIAFRKVSGVDYYYYQSSTSQLQGTGTQRTCKFWAMASTDQQQFVVFANAENIIRNLPLDSTMTREQVLDLIEMNYASTWNSATGSYDPLPMWGQTGFRTITDKTSARTDITLIRSLARIDVNVASAVQNFTLNRVHLYNTSRNGRLAPEDSKWNGTANRVTGITQPVSGWNANTSGVTFSAVGDSIVRTIYTFETPASISNIDETTGAYMIVAGSWKGEPESFYRVDFYDDTNSQFLPLYRNHYYNIQILEVSGRGFSTIDAAKKAGFSNMETSTFVWDEGDMKHLTTDGRHWISISDSEPVLFKNAQSFTLQLATNYLPDGWKAVSAASWITIDGASTGAGDTNPHPLKLNIAANTTLADRIGKIYITAGRLTDSIMVTQLDSIPFFLEVGDAGVTFPATGTIPQKQLRVDWFPPTTNVTAEAVSITGYVPVSFIGLSSSTPNIITDEDAPDNGGGRTLSFSLQPATGLALFEERRSTLRFTLPGNTPADNIVYDVLIRQYDPAIVVSVDPLLLEADPKAFVGNVLSCQIGTTFDLMVKSNEMWEVVVPTNNVIASSNISRILGEPNTSSGEMYTFKTTGNIGATTTITFRHKDNHSVSQTITVRLYNEEPNSYMARPGSLVTIPLEKMYDVWASESHLSVHGPSAFAGTLTTGVVWQTTNGMVQSVTFSGGTGSTGSINVQLQGAAEGNVLIAFYSNGSIRWTWHIWVLRSENDPTVSSTYTQPRNGAIIMNKNLGAFRSTPASVSNNHIQETYGLMYQHGRMTPFPGPFVATAHAAVIGTAGTHVSIVNLSGGSMSMAYTPIPSLPAGVANLANAIAHPLTFYYGNPAGPAPGWFTNELSVIRTNLWSPHKSYKSSYDPCPRGWKIPTEAKSLFEYIGAPTGSPVLGGYTTSVGWFPAVGYMATGTTTGVYHRRNESMSWNAGMNAEKHGKMDRLSTDVAVMSSAFTNYGFSVRCIKVE